MITKGAIPGWLESPHHVATLQRQLEDYEAAAGEATRRQKITGEGTVPELPAGLARLQPDGDTAALTAQLAELATGPHVRITLASLPGPAVKRALVTWFRGIHPAALVDFTVDRTITGGMLVQTPHHVYDLSWRERLWDNRARLVELANV